METLSVSYSGGMFKAGDLIREPFENLLLEVDMQIKKPLLSPVKGAALLAYRHFAGEGWEKAAKELESQKGG